MASCRVTHVNRSFAALTEIAMLQGGTCLFFGIIPRAAIRRFQSSRWASAHCTTSPTLARALGREVVAGLKHSPLEGESVRQGLRPQSNRWGGRNRRGRQIGGADRSRAGGGNAAFRAFLWRHCFQGRVLSMRRIRGWVGAEPRRPRVDTRGYPESQLRSSIRMARR